jgi:hypothetical protein
MPYATDLAKMCLCSGGQYNKAVEMFAAAKNYNKATGPHFTIQQLQLNHI